MGKDLSLNVYPKNYVVVDIETTGLSPNRNEIIEISAIKVINGEISETFSKLIKPSGKISPFITSLTGITDKMLENGANLKETLINFTQFCQNHIIMGHNVKFDIRFLDTNIKKTLGISFKNDYIDTLRIARCSLPELRSHKLGILAQHYGFNIEGMHRALKDCQVTNLCYQKFISNKCPRKFREKRL